MAKLEILDTTSGKVKLCFAKVCSVMQDKPVEAKRQSRFDWDYINTVCDKFWKLMAISAPVIFVMGFVGSAIGLLTGALVILSGSFINALFWTTISFFLGVFPWWFIGGFVAAATEVINHHIQLKAENKIHVTEAAVER